ncbi:unnamed protein product [Pocillopora meandrina]|uniref:Uncharacterized protein n=1 Tax=Pocillopora meandrina TaxID=46732 RepID=A0AAU9XZ12_9CNID|nr:unnamed protein product [Pocillopora meandrina]
MIMQPNRHKQIALVKFCQLGDCQETECPQNSQTWCPNRVGSFGDRDLDSLGSDGETALYKCIVNNDVKTMKVLLSSGCEVDVRNTGGILLFI